MTSELKALRDIINSSIDDIISLCESAGKEFPSLNKPVESSEFEPDGIRSHPIVAKHISLIVSAASHLIATVQQPPKTLTVSAYATTLPAALSIVEEINVAEIIRPAGTKGMHVKEIAARSHIKVDSVKLARILRFLATNHWFKEVSPDVYTHNLLSSLLDTMKDTSSPDFYQTKHKNSNGLAAIAGFGGDEVMKAIGSLKSTILDPQTSFSDGISEAAFQRGIGTPLDIWSYYDSGDKLATYRRSRFNAVMSGANKLQSPESIISMFDWSSIPPGGLIVDVGGGKGHVSLELAKAFPNLRFRIEDRELVIKEAKLYWEANLPNYILQGKVRFIDLDFFEPHPPLPQVPDVFLLRQILHDWSDASCVKLLKNLREVAGPNTKLVIIDNIIETSCEGPMSLNVTNGKNKTPIAPYPLLPNMGVANVLSYMTDLVVLACLNGSERTIYGFDSIIRESGWELAEVRVDSSNTSWWPSIICYPTTQ